MALVLADRVEQVTRTTGLADLTLAEVIRGRQSFQSVTNPSDTVIYVLEDAGGEEWEIGIGTVIHGTETVLQRTTIRQSSNADAKISLSAGTHRVFLAADAEYFDDKVAASDLAATTGAGTIGYDNSTSGLAASDVQAAIDEVDDDLDTHIAAPDPHPQYALETDLAAASGAGTVGYDNGVSGLSATDVQDAIDEVDSDLDAHIGTGGTAQHPAATDSVAGFMSAADKTKLDTIETDAKDDQNAAEVPYDNTTSGLTATDVQAAIDEVDDDLDAYKASLASSAPGQGASLVSMEGGPTLENFLSLDRVRPVESYGGIPNDSSASAMAANEAALVAAEADSYQPFFSPDNHYYVSSGYDVWQHRFASGRNTSVFIGATEYNISNSIWGIYRIDDFLSGTNNYITLRNSRDGLVIARIARGDESSASHVFGLPLDIRRDSHSLISSPGTAGGSSDLLFRDDQFQDLHYIVNDTSVKELQIVYNTTVAPSYNFDTAIAIPTESNRKYVSFRSLPAQFYFADFRSTRGILFLAREQGGNPSFGITRNNSELPFSDEFVRSDIYDPGSTVVASGVFESTFVSDTGVTGRKREYFEWNHTNGGSGSLTITPVLDTMPAEVTATMLVIAGDRLGVSLDFNDAGASGTDCQLTCRVDASYSAF